MMDGMRKAGKSIVGRIVIAILFGFLIFSFALWGIGDIFRGYGTRTVASVGSANIDVEVYRQAFQQELQQLSRRYGRNITTEQALLAGIDQQVLNRLLAEETLNETARLYGLGLPEDKLAAIVTSDQAFAGNDGKFDRQRFNDIIRQAGYTEQRFLNEQRSVALRQQIAQAIAGVPHAPAIIRNALDRYAHEERKIRYFAFGESELDPIAKASDEALKTYFEDNKDSFKLPEFRKFVSLSLKPTDLADPKAVKDEDAKAEFERLKDQLAKPERRVVRQIVFQNADEARAASEKIKSGKTFADIAAERNLKEADTNLGLVSQKEIADKSVAEAVFKLAKDQVSDVIAGTFGSVIATVSDIDAGEPATYEKFGEEIKKELALKKARNIVRDLHDKIEDQRAAAKPLEAIAKELDLKLQVIESVDRLGRDPQKGNLETLADREAILPAVFSSDIGVDNEALTTRDGGYIWYDVTGITPARDRTLEEARKDVEDAWRKDEVSKALGAKAQALVDEINKGKSFDDVAKDLKRDVKTADKLTRSLRNSELPQALLVQAFSVPEKSAASAMGSTSSERLILIVDNVTMPMQGSSPADLDKINVDLKTGLSDDYASVFINRTETDLGVKVNDKVRNLAIGTN